MSLLSLLFNRKKYKKPAVLSLSNIKGFLQGNIRSFLSDVDVLAPEEYIKEQTIWRLHQISIKSPECLNSSCIYCGCDTASKVFEDRECKSGCYPEMMNKEEWEIFKKTNNIVIDEIR